jgi:hypothetical protein
MKRMLLAVSVAVFVLGACSSGDRSEDELVADLKEGLLEEDTGFGLTEEEADCAAQGIFDAVGLERAREIDESDNDDLSLTPDEAELAAQAMVGCANVRPLFVSSFTEAGDVSDESASCLADAITDEQLVALFAAAFSGADGTEVQSEMTTSITDAMPTCLTEEELASLS